MVCNFNSFHIWNLKVPGQDAAFECSIVQPTHPLEQQYPSQHTAETCSQTPSLQHVSWVKSMQKPSQHPIDPEQHDLQITSLTNSIFEVIQMK